MNCWKVSLFAYFVSASIDGVDFPFAFVIVAFFSFDEYADDTVVGIEGEGVKCMCFLLCVVVYFVGFDIEGPGEGIGLVLDFLQVEDCFWLFYGKGTSEGVGGEVVVGESAEYVLRGGRVTFLSPGGCW